MRAAIGTFFSLVSRNGLVNVEAGHRARNECQRNVFEVATGLEFARSWNLGRKARHDGGSDGSSKAQPNLGCNFDGLSVGVGLREEISWNFEKKGWVVLASTCF